MDTILFVVIVSPCRTKEKENIFFLGSTLSHEISWYVERSFAELAVFLVLQLLHQLSCKICQHIQSSLSGKGGQEKDTKTATIKAKQK